MLSTHRPEDVLQQRGKAGCNALMVLILIAIVGVWILLNPNQGGPSPSPSASPPASFTADGSLPPPP